MRKLQAQDIGKIINLLNKMDVVDLLKDLFSGEMRKSIINRLRQEQQEGIQGTLATEMTAEEVGAEILMAVVPKVLLVIPKAQTEVNIYLADVCEVEVETIDRLDIDEYIKLIFDFFAKPELGALMKHVQKFLQ